MIKHRRKLEIRTETLRQLSRKEVGLAVGGSLGSSDPSNTVSGDDCSGDPGRSFQTRCFMTP